MGYRKVNAPKYWIPKEMEDYIEGKVISTDGVIETVYGEMGYISLLTENNEQINVGLSASLKIMAEMIREGDDIKIVYNGEEFNKKTKRRFKSFDLYIAEE